MAKQIVTGRTVKVKMTEPLAKHQPFCAICGKEIEVGMMAFLDTITTEVYHVKKGCRRTAIVNTARQQGLTAA